MQGELDSSTATHRVPSWQSKQVERRNRLSHRFAHGGRICNMSVDPGCRKRRGVVLHVTVVHSGKTFWRCGLSYYISRFVTLPMVAVPPSPTQGPNWSGAQRRTNQLSTHRCMVPKSMPAVCVFARKSCPSLSAHLCRQT